MTAGERLPAVRRRIDEELAPLVRCLLVEHLPEVGGRGWWRRCVRAQLPEGRRADPADGLEQFGYAELADLAGRNWRSLKPLLQLRDDLRNYLYQIRTFRIKLERLEEGEPTPEEIAHISHTIDMTVAMLSGVPDRRRTGRGRLGRVLLAIGVAVLCAGAAALLFRMQAQAPDEAAKTVAEDPCAALAFIREEVRNYKALVDVDVVFREEIRDYESRCKGATVREDLSEERRMALRTMIEDRVEQAIMNIRP